VIRKTFKGGVHPPHYKEATEHREIEKARLPQRVIIPLQQHIGAPCELIVKVGDKVKVGQKIGEGKAFVSAPVHASISGEVVSIETLPHPVGGKVLSVVIQSDGLDEVDNNIKPFGSIESLSPEELKKIIREAGIVGMGGAAFPTQVKLSPPPEKTIDTVIINGAECEPYLTADHRIMLERTEDVVFGIKVVMRAVGVSSVYIGIEDNKPDAIKKLEEAVSGEENIKVIPLRAKYPQGGEKQLIYAITGREVPSGGLPMEVGVIVQNVGTVTAIARAVKTGMPLIERVVTVTGSGVKKPKNLLARIGTPFKDLIEECGGFNGTPGKVIMGGPMMGIAQTSLEVPVIKGTSGILVLTKEEAKRYEPGPCIKCARCVDICPINLLPTRISHFSQMGMWDEAEEYNALDCIECGSCSYICPSKIPLVQRIRIAKGEILARKRKK
jgi:electron transport complex protein RnfC